MNKKFMVVALMAALSTVATANLEDKVNANKVAINTVLGSVIDLEGKVNNNEAAIGKLEQKVEESTTIAGQAQNNAANALIQNSKQDKDIAALGDKLNGKADVDFVTGQVNDAYNELDGKVNDKLAGKVDKEDFGKLDNEVGGLVGKVEAIDQDKNRLEAEMNDKLNGKADVDFVTGQVNDAYNELDGKLNSELAGKVDKEDFNRLDNEVGQITADVEAIKGELDNKVNTALQGAFGDKVDQEDFDRLDNEVGGLVGKVEAIDQDKDRLEAEMNNKLNGKVDKEDFNRLDNEVGALTGKVEAVEKENERVNTEQDKNIAANKDAIAQNKNDIAANKDAIEKETADRKAEDERLQGQINEFNNKFAGYDGRLSGLEKKVDHLDDKMNKGLSLMAAMNAVDFQNVQTGEMALGAGIGHYGNAQSVALGVAYSPVEDLTVNAKYSITAGDPDSFAVGAGATYKFKVGR